MHATGSAPAPGTCRSNRSAHRSPLQHRAMHCLSLVAMLSPLLANAYMSCTCPITRAQNSNRSARPRRRAPFSVFFALAIRHLLPTPLLHLGRSLTRHSLRLRYTRGIRVSARHAAICRPRCVDRVQWNNAPQPPRPVPRDGNEENNTVGPVYHVPHVLGKALGFEVFACALQCAFGGQGRSGLALEEELDQELGGGEQDI
jgi:hypothetical protein